LRRYLNGLSTDSSLSRKLKHLSITHSVYRLESQFDRKTPLRVNYCSRVNEFKTAISWKQ